MTDVQSQAQPEMHLSIFELTNELVTFTGLRSEKPTRADRNAMLALRRKIADLANDPTVLAHPKGNVDRGFLYVSATRLANLQEEFWEGNGCKFSDE